MQFVTTYPVWGQVVTPNGASCYTKVKLDKNLY